MDNVQNHLYLKPSVIVEGVKLVCEYNMNMNLSIHCEFGEILPDYLWDRLASYLRNDNIRLLEEKILTFV